jgi:hypothetical protein
MPSDPIALSRTRVRTLVGKSVAAVRGNGLLRRRTRTPKQDGINFVHIPLD